METLFRNGKAFSVFPYRVIYMPAKLPTEKFPVQAGFTASGRNFPHATDRNRIKRLGRECWRLQKQELYDALGEGQQLAVFFIYTDKKIADFPTLRHKFSVILNRLQKELSGETK
ncbi:ribonuclease P protein component [Chitinophaga horti]|uniref:Ribonuclease P protein component n=1 Tax=Chitinophaga horti TaxID=2920382 RepID=A0ABY6JCI0_9BACT|nr:ribonuclease P protein component [Chitinophaga horti]UYQ95996.1 ribonuclease P protein component [Chitinophaga horti]